MSKRRVFKPKSSNQHEFVLSMVENDIVFCIGPAGSGKAQPLDSIVYTPEGEREIGSIKVGDSVSTPNGVDANVIGIFPQGRKSVYRVMFSDGSSAECCMDHLWTIESPNNFKGRKTLSLKEILDYGLYTESGKKKIRIPISKPVEFLQKKSLPIDAYMMGLLLGDGCFSGKVGFSTSDQEILDYFVDNIDSNHMVTKNGKYDYIISKRKTIVKTRNKYHKIIKNLGLWKLRSHEKFIPKEYLFSSINDRWNLYYGLMDADGTISKSGNTISYTTVSKRLSEDVRFLIESLGGTVTVSERTTQYNYKGVKKNGKKSYRLYIKLDVDKHFRLKRKQDRVVKRTKYFPQRYIVGVQYSRTTECVCIKLDSKDELYLTNRFIVTHNTACSVGLAVEHLLENKCHRIIVTRPIVGTDEEHSEGIGFLPGDIKEKTDPYFRPIYDELLTYMDSDTLDRAIREDRIELSPLDFMRGRTFHNAFVLLDEAQNCSYKQIKMFTTRLGSNSKMVISGDIDQYDRRGESGLDEWYNGVIPGLNGVGRVELSKEDIVRHPLVSAILTASEKYEGK